MISSLEAGHSLSPHPNAGSHAFSGPTNLGVGIVVFHYGRFGQSGCDGSHP